MKLIRFAMPMLAVLLSTGLVFGQGRQGGSGGSTFGSSGRGSMFGGGGGLGNSGFGSGSFGSGGIGGGGFGGGGMGGMGGGMGGGFGGGGMGGGMGGMGGGMGMQGGQMGNFGNNQSFVGTDSGDVRQLMMEMGRNSSQFTQTMNRAMSRRGGRDRDSGENQAPPIRVQLRIAFDYPTAGASAVPTVVAQRLEKILTAKKLPMPELEFQSGVVTLTGIAPTPSDRLLISRLVSLEPGVARVVNQMTVPEPIAVPTPQE